MSQDVYKSLVPVLPDLVRIWYEQPGNSCGGCLHIVTDDGNVDDDSLEFCRAAAVEHPLAMTILEILATLPEEERDEAMMSPEAKAFREQL